MTMIQLSCRNLTKSYNYRPIFKNLNFDILTTGVFVIAGRNGSGKSTLLKSLAGIIQTDKGELIWSRPIKKGITSPYSFPFLDLSAYENIRIFLNIKDRSHCKSLCTSFQILLSEDRPLSEYSSGILQRFRMLLAFHEKNDVLFLDEPGSNLDQEGKFLFESLIDRYKNDKLIFIASNENNEIALGKILIDFNQSNSSIII